MLKTREVKIVRTLCDIIDLIKIINMLTTEECITSKRPHSTALCDDIIIVSPVTHSLTDEE